MSQANLAEKIRRDRSTIAKIEAGKIDLTPLMRKTICDVFGVREEWLLTGRGPMYFMKSIHMSQLEEKSKEIGGSAPDLFRQMKAAYILREEVTDALTGDLLGEKHKISHYDMFLNSIFFEMFKRLRRIYLEGNQVKIDALQKLLNTFDPKKDKR